MKNIFLFSIILISSFACNDNHQTVIPPKPIISVDSTMEGKMGEPESRLTVITHLDTTIIKRFSKYWVSKSNIYERTEFFDSLGREYKQVDFSIDKNDFKHSYVWHDTTKKIIEFDGEYHTITKNFASIDTSFRKNGKIKEVKQKYGDTDLTENFNTNNIIEKKILYAKSLRYMFLQQGNSFYKVRTDIPFEYAERIPASKTDFGEALNLFYKEKNNSENRFKQLYNLPLE